MPVKNSAKMTKIIFDAVKASGQRALVSAGWGGLGGTKVPENVFILGESSSFPSDPLYWALTVSLARQATARMTGCSSSAIEPYR